MKLKEVDRKEIVEKVRKVAVEKKKWHLHFLTPKCVFNNKDKFALILENEDDEEGYVCYFDEKPEELKIFENLFYGRPEDFDQY